MNHGKAIYNILNSSSNVTNLVSSRIYPLRVPQNTSFPCITYQTISNVPINTKSGFKTYQARTQVNAFANNYSSCHEVASAVRGALSDVIYGTYGDVVVQTIKLVNQIDQEEDFADAEGIVHFIMDFIITYNE